VADSFNFLPVIAPAAIFFDFRQFLRGLSMLLLAGFCLVVSGCLDGSEDIRIESDGSGQASFDYFLPAAAVASQGGNEALRTPVESWVRSEQGLHLESLEVSDKGESTRLHVVLRFDSIKDLIRAVSGEGSASLPGAMRHLLGTFQFVQNGRHIEFSRTVHPVEALGGSLLLVPADDLARHHLHYRIALPVKPDTHNATSTEDDGRTLIWDIRLDEAVKSPPKLEFTATLPIPWWLWGAGGLAAAGALWLAAKRRAQSAEG